MRERGRPGVGGEGEADVKGRSAFTGRAGTPSQSRASRDGGGLWSRRRVCVAAAHICPVCASLHSAPCLSARAWLPRLPSLLPRSRSVLSEGLRSWAYVFKRETRELDDVGMGKAWDPGE